MAPLRHRVYRDCSRGGCQSEPFATGCAQSSAGRARSKPGSSPVRGGVSGHSPDTASLPCSLYVAALRYAAILSISARSLLVRNVQGVTLRLEIAQALIEQANCLAVPPHIEVPVGRNDGFSQHRNSRCSFDIPHKISAERLYPGIINNCLTASQRCDCSSTHTAEIREIRAD
jgi:hypothetical protein